MLERGFIMKNLTEKQIERVNEVFEDLYYGEYEEIETIEDKIEAIEQYYESAGFDIGTNEEKFWSFLGL